MSRPAQEAHFGWTRALSAVLLAGSLATGCSEDRVIGGIVQSARPDAGSVRVDAGGADAAAVPPDPGCAVAGAGPGIAYDREGCGVGGLLPGGYCGDGRVQPPEECDDGNRREDDDCSAACLRRVCGNGRVDPGETCDLIDVSCSATCQIIPPAAPAVCGNGTTEGAEECDDGNLDDGDGCSSVCLQEVCGNRRLDSGETCDPPDPGARGCDAHCRAVRCGDGQKAESEECDDGNLENGDGCDAACRHEGCGDGRLEPGEDCEPPGTERCDTECHAVRLECGNGKLEPGEACDDRNGAFGDGCSPTCEREECGNGHVEAPADECEPPGTRGCTSQCRRPRCGDGELSAPDEECEDGNSDNGDGCSADCRLEFCGNGRLEAPEQCEPTLSSNCSSNCTLRGVSELALPVGGAPFALVNPGFEGSLLGWQPLAAGARSVEHSSLDANGDPESGAAQLSPGSALQQCIRTTEGAEYVIAARARLLPGQDEVAALDLGVRFHAGARCSGAVLDGLVTSRSIDAEDGEWSVAMLPPESFNTTLTAPDGAGSMLVWFEAVPGASLLLDEVELVRVAPSCGDGIPDTAEECEPSVTPGCDDDCTLPRECGDGLAAPGECSGPDACAEDCGLPAVCGDGKVTAPEECDPPHAEACSVRCTLLHGFCGNRVLDPGEQCDPPNGTSCGLDCQNIACGDGKMDAPETCDPPGPDCSGHCRLKRELPSVCGNGWLEGAEQCDPPNPDTWCTSSCQRRNPAEACGDGRVDGDLGEQCDPPSFARNCGTDCRIATCGDGKVTGEEECEPGLVQPENCRQDCKFLSDQARGCIDCLASSCAEPADGAQASSTDLFEGCFALKGVAQAGPGKGLPLSQLCIEAVECMRQTDCAVEFGANAEPLACYCGKEVVIDPSQPDTFAETARRRAAFLACRDGSEVHGACRAAIERAAEATGPGLAVAAFDAQFGRPAVQAAVRLMSQCGQKAGGTCRAACSVPASPDNCGNGIVEAGELCDPGDAIWAGKCAARTCTLLPCGNGKIDPGETCDVADPYTNINGSCNDHCQQRTVCGDGVLTQSVEACDPGPNGSWEDCCRPAKDGDQSQLAACDKNGNGQIEEAESCQVPSICNNGKIEGLEECDPPEPGKCDDICHIISVDDSPCGQCVAQNCSGETKACLDSDQPSFKVACREVVRCIEETNCAPEGGLEPCLCGDLDFRACNEQRGQGPCADVMIDNSTLCLPDKAPGCVAPKILNPAQPTGAAAQLIQCRVNFCYAECFGG